MTDKEALEICKQAIKYISIKYSNINDKNISEQFHENLRDETDINIMIEAIEKQKVIKNKIKWLKTFNEYDTISIKEVIDAFEDCEINIYD